MRRFTSLIALGFIAGLSACDRAEPVALGDPVRLSLPTDAASGPRLSERPDGGLVLSWMASVDDGHVLRFASIVSGHLGEPLDATVEDRMFVNWADLPSVLQVNGAHWLAHWLQYNADKTYSYDVVVSQSFDSGVTWSDPVKVHSDGTPTEHGFVSMYRAPEGVALLWLDGRSTPDAPLTLRSAVVTSAGEVAGEQLVDDSVCDCCQTDIAVSSRGPVAVYRDRTVGEIRDIYITRRVNGLWTPGTPIFPDDWNIAGCPVNGPSIVARDDNVAVAWFAAANDTPIVRVLLSADGGQTFGEPIEISTGRVSGYVGLTFIDGRNLAVSWVGRNGSGGNLLQVRSLSMTGKLGGVLPVGEITQVRVFPQLGFQDGHLFLFWTDQVDGDRELRGARVPVL